MYTFHLPQECASPQFSLNTPANRAFPSPSMDPMFPGAGHRRLSLQQSMSMMRSEPNIHRRSSLDPLTLKKLMGPLDFHQVSSGGGQSQSLGRLPLHANSPGGPAHLHSSPHGSNSHLSNHGSNSSLNDQLFPTFTPPDDPMDGRSKSLGNIFSSLSGGHPSQPQQQQDSPPLHPAQQAVHQSSPTSTAAGLTSTAGSFVNGSGPGTTGAQKRRSTYGFNSLSRGTIKRPRYVFAVI